MNLWAPNNPSIPAQHQQATRSTNAQASLDEFHKNEQIVHFAVSHRIGPIPSREFPKTMSTVELFTCQHTLSLACSPLYHHVLVEKVSDKAMSQPIGGECQWALPQSSSYQTNPELQP